MRWLVPALALAVSGCLFDTSKEIPFQPADGGDAHGDAGLGDTGLMPPDADGGEASDLADPPDLAGLPDTAAIDQGDPDLGQPDLSEDVAVCDGAPSPSGTPMCNPVTQGGCGVAEVCDVVADSSAEPTEPRVSVACRDIRGGELRGGGHGEACDEDDPAACRPGHRCVGGSCRSFCQFADGAGCPDTEVCDVHFPADEITHFGVCVAACRD